MKYIYTALLALLAIAAYAADPVSLQQMLQSAPKETAPQGQTSVVTVRGGVVRRFPLMSTARLVPVATTTTPGVVKVGTGLAVLPDGTLNNTGIAGVASFNGRGGAVTPASGDYSIGQISGAATVASTGSYADLSNKPTIPSAQVNSDWNAGSGVAQILNKPTIPTSLSQLSQSPSYRTVTDAEKDQWNNNSSPVQSFNGRTGAIQPQSGDYTAVMVGADVLGSATSVQTNLNAHASRTDNPHAVTKAQVGLSNVDNTSDLSKPVSTATQTALNLKANTSALATVATSGAYADLTGKPSLGTAAAKDVPATGDATSTQVVLGSDSRNTNARTPTAHASSHASGGSDPVTVSDSQVKGGGTNTLQSYVKLSAAVCNGSTDDGTTINGEVSALTTAGGGTLRLPEGKVCAVASTIMLGTFVTIDLNKSVLKWTGTAGGTMVSNSVAGPPLADGDIRNGYLDPGTNAYYVLDLDSIRGGVFEDLTYISTNANLTPLRIRATNKHPHFDGIFGSRNFTFTRFRGPSRYYGRWNTNGQILSKYGIIFEGDSVSNVVGAISIASAGSGYAVGDVVTIAGGSGDAKAYVASVSGGVPNFIRVYDRGTSGYATATNVATTGGSGTGLTVNITRSTAAAPVTNATLRDTVCAVTDAGHRFVRYVDNIFMRGQHEIGLNAAATTGVIINDEGDGSSWNGVNNIEYDSLVVWATDTTPGKIGVKINKSEAININYLNEDPLTYWGTSGNDLFRDAYGRSYHIRVMTAGATEGRVYEKGNPVYFGPANTGIQYRTKVQANSSLAGDNTVTLPTGTGVLALTSDIPASYTLPAATSSTIGGVTISGNTTKAASSSGTLTGGHCAQWDVNGNIVDAGAACGTGSGSGNMTNTGASAAGQVPKYTDTSGTALTPGYTVGTGASNLLQLGSSAELSLLSASTIHQLYRTTSATNNGSLSVLGITAYNSGATVQDFFGSQMEFRSRDSDGVINTNGAITGVRMGQDNSGLVSVKPYYYGAQNSDLRIYPTGQVAVNPRSAVTAPSAEFLVEPPSLYNAYYYNGSTYTAARANANSQEGSAFTVLNGTGDYFYLAAVNYDSKVSVYRFDIVQAAVGLTLAAEYWNGSTWSALTITDGTNNLSQDGAVTFTPPSDWVATTVNGGFGTWMRLKTTTSPSTPATASYILPSNYSLVQVKVAPEDNTPAVEVSKTGNVGVGQAAGTEKLEITGNAKVAGSVLIQQDTPRLWQFDNGAARSASNPEWGHRPVHSDGLYHIESSADGSTWADAMTLSRNGNAAAKTFAPTIPAAATDAATVTFDLSAGDSPSVTLGGNRTLAFSNPQVGAWYRLKLIQDATGSRTVTWPSTGLVCTFMKEDGTATTTGPTLHTAASTMDIIVIHPTSTTSAECYARGY